MAIQKKVTLKHPSKQIKNILIEKGISTNKLADLLGVSFYKAERVVDGFGSVSVDIAIRLSKLFPDFNALDFLIEQVEFDIYEIEKMYKDDYKKIKKFVGKNK